MKLLAAAFAFVLASTLPADGRAQAVDLRPIQHRFLDMAVGSERLHISNDAQWRAFWVRFSSSPPPRIDFQQHDVLVALMGVKGSGGYSIHIRGIEAGSRGTKVGLLLCSSPEDSAQIAALTSPLDARLSSKLSEPVAWQASMGTTGKPPCT